MSTVEHEAALEAAHTEQDTERAERRVLRRDFRAQITEGDGRTVDVRIVPFGETITHNDGLGGLPVGVDYQEEWMPGVFRHQLKAADKVVGNFEHQQGIGGIVARATTLDERGDGYHATFRMLNVADADKTLELIREGVLDGVSLEAQPVRSVRSGSGTVQRVKANLRAVAFTRFAAYAGARVLAVREEPEILIDEALLPVDMDPELVQRLRASGIALPDRYQAHPATTGTPAETGTPEDGTRQSVNTPTSEEHDECHTERADARTAC